MKEKTNLKHIGISISLFIYDFIIFLLVSYILLSFYKGGPDLTISGYLTQITIAGVLIFGIRRILSIYRQVWRYGGIQCYIRLLFSDGISFFSYFIVILFPAKIYLLFKYIKY